MRPEFSDFRVEIGVIRQVETFRFVTSVRMHDFLQQFCGSSGLLKVLYNVEPLSSLHLGVAIEERSEFRSLFEFCFRT